MIKTDVLTDDAIVQRVRDGETVLYELLMRRHNQKLYRIARGMGVSNEDCDDILQQTYIQAYLKLDQFKGSSAFSTWLIRILINQCLMDRRKSHLSVSLDGELIDLVAPDAPRLLEIETPESVMLRTEIRTLLEQAISRLPIDYRSVYVMKEIEGMSIKEIASTLDLTEVNVKVRIMRARARLRNQLKKYLGKDELFEFGNSRCDAVVREVMLVLGSLS